MTIEFTAPIRIESVNETRDRHWSVRKSKTDAQANTVAMVWRAHCGPQRIDCRAFDGSRILVTLTRIAPRPLDDDNATGGWKAVRDEIARILGVDDGDERITFRYQQERGKPKEYAARIRIDAA